MNEYLVDMHWHWQHWRQSWSLPDRQIEDLDDFLLVKLLQVSPEIISRRAVSRTNPSCFLVFTDGKH